MLIFLYLAAVTSALYGVSKILLPEMRKPPISPKSKPKPVLGRSSFELVQTGEFEKRIEKLETLLAEKNKNIRLLQTELNTFLVQVRDFDKVKILLEEEIFRLREQNRIFRSELGIPTVQLKENSITT